MISAITNWATEPHNGGEESLTWVLHYPWGNLISNDLWPINDKRLLAFQLEAFFARKREYDHEALTEQRKPARGLQTFPPLVSNLRLRRIKNARPAVL